MRTFKIGNHGLLRVGVGVVAILSISFTLLWGLLSKTYQTGWMEISMVILFLVAGVLAILNTLTFVLLIDDQSISVKTLFGSKSLVFSEIIGYRIEQEIVTIYSKAKRKRPLTFDLNLKEKEILMTWLVASFPDFGEANSYKEETVILSDVWIGWNKEERTLKLNRARRTAWLLNAFGWGILAWAIFWPKPYESAILICIAFPLLSLIFAKTSDGLIHFFIRENSAYPHINWAITIPGLALVWRWAFDYELENYSNILLPAILLDLALMAIVLKENTEFNLSSIKGVAECLVLALSLLVYTAGVTVNLNVLYDNRPPQTYKAQVLSKEINRIEKSKKSYSLKVGPWGPRKSPENVSTSKSLFSKAEVGDSVTISLKKGRFDIHWFIVAE